MNFQRTPWAIASLALFSVSAHATDLIGAWKAAQERDPELAAARVIVEQAAYKKTKPTPCGNPVWAQQPQQALADKTAAHKAPKATACAICRSTPR